MIKRIWAKLSPVLFSVYIFIGFCCMTWLLFFAIGSGFNTGYSIGEIKQQDESFKRIMKFLELEEGTE